MQSLKCLNELVTNKSTTKRGMKHNYYLEYSMFNLIFLFPKNVIVIII